MQPGLTLPAITPDSLISTHSLATSGRYISNGTDNLFPYILTKIGRISPVHRGIINKKVEFIAGADWTTENEELERQLRELNADGEDFTAVLKKVALDDMTAGYAYFEVVTNAQRNMLNIYHHDFTTVRLTTDKTRVGIKKDWRTSWLNSAIDAQSIRELPLWPAMEQDEDGYLRSMVMLKGYEPEFHNYGVPDWIAGMNVAAISYKTDRWNLSRIDNAFQPSGVFLLNGIEDDEEADEAKKLLEEEFSGEGSAGKVVFMVTDTEGDAGKFVPLNIKFDADWDSLDKNAISKLIAAHSWYRSLMSLPDSTGFDTERILNEWRMANKSTIAPKQKEYLKAFSKVIEEILGIDCSDLTFVNKPPVKESKPPYMRIWEARREDGLEYDPDDPAQQEFIASIITRRTNNRINA